MSLEVRLPDLGESVTHAKLAAWLKREGDAVLRGELIAEVETDKTTVEIEAPGDGVLSKIHVGEGTENIPINSLLALISDGASLRASEVMPAPSRAQGTPPSDQDHDQPKTGVTPLVSSVPSIESVERKDSDVAASPLVRRMAYIAGISLEDLRGTGPGGRITKSDVEALLGPDQRQSRRAAAPLVSTVGGDFDMQPLSTLRRVTGERLAHAKQTIPHFYLRIECAMDGVANLRKQLIEQSDEKLSFTVFTVRAAALALRRVPAANSTWVDGGVRLHRSIDIAIAVNTPAGLIAPVIRRADEKSLLALARDMHTASEQARAGSLKLEDYSHGTFTISNLGMYGVSALYPIINPPQTCILGVGAIEERPVVRDHAIVIAHAMTCTLSADHRALDGATGAEFLAAFRELIEDPRSLIQ